MKRKAILPELAFTVLSQPSRTDYNKAAAGLFFGALFPNGDRVIG